MLEYNEIKPKKYIILDGEPYEVLSSHVFRKQQRKPVNATKLRHLLANRVTEHSFHQSDKVQEAEIDKREIKYLYENRGQYWFCEKNDPAKRFELPADKIGNSIKFIKGNSIVTVQSFGENILGIEVPIKVELKVKEAPPAIKGDTVSGGNKQITLETGAVINAPMFIKEGDTIRINTETGEYVERA